ncbi:hypothetical protein [Lysobacter sp. CA196]|uniref:hypothetical protein n=1 Tax=Lysobacter sp. CA196 TaxID=3455606 RepID=UPI003F8D30CD
MSAIWPVGPPKPSAPILAQTRSASANPTRFRAVKTVAVSLDALQRWLRRLFNRGCVDSRWLAARIGSESLRWEWSG